MEIPVEMTPCLAEPTMTRLDSCPSSPDYLLRQFRDSKSFTNDRRQSHGG